MNNPKQDCDKIYHCAKEQDPMWFGSGMIIWKPIPKIGMYFVASDP